MFRPGRATLIVATCAAALGGMLIIPGRDSVAVADVPAVTSVSSQETIAAIDAMLSPPTPVLAERASRTVAAPKPEPDNFQTAALTTPVVETPAIETPAIDPNLRADAIGRSAVNLRSGPSTSASTLTVLKPGQAIRTGASNGGWVEVTLDDGTKGWVFSRYLASVAAAAPPEPPAPKAKQITTPTATSTSTAKAVIKGSTGGNIEGRTARIEASLTARSIPSSSARSVFTTVPGERVKIVDVRGKWIRIVTTDGSSGWIQSAG